MKALVIGLGSMGKRRIRNLKVLGVEKLAGVDPREDRRAEAATAYAVPTFADAQRALRKFAPDVAVISTPPDRHMDYAFLACEQRVPCFIEASVVDADRILPGDGDMQLGPLLARLTEIDYGGYVSVELMNPQIWRIPPLQWPRMHPPKSIAAGSRKPRCSSSRTCASPC